MRLYAVLALFSFAPQAFAARPFTPEDLLQTLRLDGVQTHVFVVPVAGGAPRDLTFGDSDWPTWRLGGGDDYAFSADGSVLYVSHKEAAREAWSTNSDILALSLAGGPPRNLTSGNPGDNAQPKESPDGRFLAWLSQARDGYESDQWKLKLLDKKSGKATIAGDFDDDVGSFQFRRDGKRLVGSVVHQRAPASRLAPAA
jgi:hypothetical protein